MLLTIITINYNNAAGLRKTVESVVNQTSHDFEYIIVDGGALQPSVSGLPVRPLAETNSKGVVRGDAEVFLGFAKDVYSTENGFTRCSWLSPKGGIEGGFFSEPDTGIYNAMNKGIRMAKGDYIHFLNSGDWLVDEKVVEKMLSALTNSPQGEGCGEVKTDILVGNVISVRPDGKKLFKQNAKEISLFTFYRGTIEHTSAYIRRELFNEFGLYDESLRIVSDWKWYLQVAGLRKANVQFTDTYVTYFDTTGISSTNFDLDKAERRRVLEELLPAPILADYDKYAFDIEQMERLKKHPLAHKAVWLLERLFFKFEKWRIKYGAWK